MKPKLAILFESSPFDRKGMFNAIHEKVKRLVADGTFQVEAFCIHSRDNAFTRRVRHTPECEKVDSIIVEGVTYHILWYPFTITDHILTEILSCKPLFFKRFLRHILPLFKSFDLVEAHSTTAGCVACELKKEFGIPYVVTWHGSDIHTHPYKNSLVRKATCNVIRSAEMNVYVSKALMLQSRLLVDDAPSQVIFNGVSENFFPLEAAKRELLRRDFHIPLNTRVVAFVGNLHPVKNVLTLPRIFKNLKAAYSGNLLFWIIGDGKLRRALEAELRNTASNLPVVLWGNIPSPEMPRMMNCIDLLVLPSLNEGLPLVCCEALRCGCNVVASDVGGVAEVVGKDFVTALAEDFAEKMAVLAADTLRRRDGSSEIFQPLASCFDWNTSCKAELRLLKQVAGV